MRPRLRALVTTLAMLLVLVSLALAFPRVMAFTELAARELRYFWWLILIVALAAWLIWGVGRSSKR